MKVGLFVIILLLPFNSCILNTWDSSLNLNNTSNDTIAYTYNIGNINDTVPDLEYCDESQLYEILPNSSEDIAAQFKWKKAIGSVNILHYFIYSLDTIKKYGLCKTLKNNKQLKRFDLNHDELEKMNWRITYDGKK